MRTFASIQMLVTRDSDQRQKLVDQLLSMDDTAATSAEFKSEYITLPVSSGDVAVGFDGVSSASTVLIVAYADITVKLNGVGSPAIPLRKVPATAGGVVLSNLQKFDQPGVMFWRGKVDQIHIANPSSTLTADVFVALVGNAT